MPVKMCQIWWLEQIMSAERSPILGQMRAVPAQMWATGLYIVYIHTYRSVSKCAHARINARGPTIGLAGFRVTSGANKKKRIPWRRGGRIARREPAAHCVAGVGPVPVQMWQRCPSPGADVAGARIVPVQMW